MVNRDVFQQRLSICKTCEFWQGVCLKGHNLGSPLGCPVRRFEPVSGAGYLPDTVVVKPLEPVRTAGCSSCGKPVDETLKPLTQLEAIDSLRVSMAKWAESGFSLASDEVFSARTRVCRACPSGRYQWFQCRQCRCVVYVKAKLATESCPLGHWPQ